MSYSWQRLPDRPPVMHVPDELRRVFVAVADALIPGGDMPAPSDVRAGQRLDDVLRSRPDLATPLLAALRHAPTEDQERWVVELSQSDPSAHRAVVVTVLAAYYLSDEVRRHLGYPGQQTAPVNIGFPDYVEEGLLERVVERGPLYRPVPEDA